MRSWKIPVSLVLFLAAASGAWAQDADVDEVVAYQAFYQASQAKDTAKAIETAQAYLKKYPNGANADYIKKWLAPTLAQARGAQFNQALKDGNSAEMVRIGREQLAEHPDDLSYLISLALNLRKNVLLGSNAKPELEAAAGEFSRKALQLIQGGAVPPGTDPAKWKKETTLAVLEQNLAIVADHANRPDEALQHYEKSLELAGGAASLAGYSGFYCGKLRKDKYDAAVAAYQALPEDARGGADPKPEAKAALDAVNEQADAAIDCWAVFVGATEKNNPFGDARAPVAEALKALYASRHPDQPEGYQALVARYVEK